MLVSLFTASTAQGLMPAFCDLQSFSILANCNSFQKGQDVSYLIEVCPMSGSRVALIAFFFCTVVNEMLTGSRTLFPKETLKDTWPAAELTI